VDDGGGAATESGGRQQTQIGLQQHLNVGFPSLLTPTADTATVLVAPRLSTRTLDHYRRATTAVAKQHPGLLVGTNIITHNHQSQLQHVASYLPESGMHILCKHQSSNHHYGTRHGRSAQTQLWDPTATIISLTDLDWTFFHPGHLPVAPFSCIDPVHHHFRECHICMEWVPNDRFAEFCFKDFRVTGDSTRISGPRHLKEICKGCLKRHAMDCLAAGGRLYVECPSQHCSRSLQTLELKQIITASAYTQLVGRIKEMEEAQLADARCSSLVIVVHGC
jgi:hypothetical protein